MDFDCVQCALDLEDMTLGYGYDMPLGHVDNNRVNYNPDSTYQ